MKLSRSEYRPLMRDLRAIRNHQVDEDYMLYGKSFNVASWEDEQAWIGLTWRATSIGKSVLDVVNFKPPSATRYTLFVEPHDSSVITTFSINQAPPRGSVYMERIDKDAAWDLEASIRSEDFANSLGLNEVTVDDILVLQGVVSRRCQTIQG